MNNQTPRRAHQKQSINSSRDEALMAYIEAQTAAHEAREREMSTWQSGRFSSPKKKVEFVSWSAPGAWDSMLENQTHHPASDGTVRRHTHITTNRYESLPRGFGQSFGDLNLVRCKCKSF